MCSKAPHPLEEPQVEDVGLYEALDRHVSHAVFQALEHLHIAGLRSQHVRMLWTAGNGQSFTSGGSYRYAMILDGFQTHALAREGGARCVVPYTKICIWKQDCNPPVRVVVPGQQAV